MIVLRSLLPLLSPWLPGPRKLLCVSLHFVDSPLLSPSLARLSPLRCPQDSAFCSSLHCLPGPTSASPVPSTGGLSDLYFSPPDVIARKARCPLKLSVSIMKPSPKHYPLLPSLSRTFLPFLVDKLSEPF